MQFLDRVPNRAIFDESIQIAKVMGNQSFRRLVTGVLHRMVRVGFPKLAAITDQTERRSVKYSMPAWLIHVLDRQVGQTRADQIMASVNQPGKMAIRVNLAKVTVDKLKNQLKDEGFKVEASPLVDDGLFISGKPAIATPSFPMGWFTIQDHSAMLPVEAMNFKPNDKILDACAAPGGKTCQMAEHLIADNGGKIIALDLHAKRLKKVMENAKRLGVADRIEAQALDARKVAPAFPNETFNKVLVDAPCSGLGLMRNKPEIRYFKQPEDVQHLHEIQGAILDAVASKVKVGGHLMYSTCTITAAENQQTITEFLKRHPEFDYAPTHFEKAIHGQHDFKSLQLYPDDFDTDGFFVCDLQRIK